MKRISEHQAQERAGKCNSFHPGGRSISIKHEIPSEEKRVEFRSKQVARKRGAIHELADQMLNEEQ